MERLLRESFIPRIAPVSPQLILCFIAEKVLTAQVLLSGATGRTVRRGCVPPPVALRPALQPGAGRAQDAAYSACLGSMR